MSIKVAVRVRPFNSREIEIESKLCVEMNGVKTTLLNLEDPAKNRDFSFDYSFWSHSGFELKEDGLAVPISTQYHDQRYVYDQLGESILNNAWEGYNCCLLAYGQTGSGKSYSMVGYAPNRGIVPIACEEIFKRIDANESSTTEYEVCISMLEIYNEKVHDLLIPTSKRTQGGLKIRENNTIGFYVENLSKHPVSSYDAIEAMMEQGSCNRTIAATQMNASSSRAHTIIAIEFKRIEVTDGHKTEKFSLINLVDLAGSEKVGKTGATGDRLKEAGGINKSLSVLGLVIMTLADLESGKKGVKVPYRDSCLTRILANALGGNSKTVMICAISPSNDNFEESLSTLRYADQAKKIKNKAVVNESAVDKMIRELNEENASLKQTIMMLREKMNLGPGENLEIAALEDQVKGIDNLVNDLQITHQQRVVEAQNQETEILGVAGSHKKERKSIQLMNHLTNLNEDPILNNKINHCLSNGITTVGKKSANPAPDIILWSTGVNENHAYFSTEENKHFLTPVEGTDPDQTHVNGKQLVEKMEIFHNDRIVFGTNAVFLVIKPLSSPRPNQNLPKEIDWEFAQNEILEDPDYVKPSDSTRISQAEAEGELENSQERAEQERIIQEQVQEYEKKLLLLENQIKEESLKHKCEQEKIAAKLASDELLVQLERERIQQNLEREKRKLCIQAQESLRLYRIRQKRVLRSQLTKVQQKVYEINYIAKQMKRNIILTPKIDYTFTDVNQINSSNPPYYGISVHVKNNEEGTENTWDYETFHNRFQLIEELYQNYQILDNFQKPEKEQDPFWDPDESKVVGEGFLKISLLSHGLAVNQKLRLIGDKQIVGSLDVRVAPNNNNSEPDSQELNLASFIDDPNQLLGSRFEFKISIGQGVLPKNHSIDTLVEYSFESDDGQYISFSTQKLEGRNCRPDYGYSKIHVFESVTPQLVNYLEMGVIRFRVRGTSTVGTDEEAPLLSSEIQVDNQLLKKLSSNESVVISQSLNRSKQNSNNDEGEWHVNKKEKKLEIEEKKSSKISLGKRISNLFNKISFDDSPKLTAQKNSQQPDNLKLSLSNNKTPSNERQTSNKDNNHNNDSPIISKDKRDSEITLEHPLLTASSNSNNVSGISNSQQGIEENNDQNPVLAKTGSQVTTSKKNSIVNEETQSGAK